MFRHHHKSPLDWVVADEQTETITGVSVVNFEGTQTIEAIFEVYALSSISLQSLMDITATLNAITTLSVEDRILLVQAIWDSIAAEQGYPDLTETQKHELDRRIEGYESDPDNILTWDEIKAAVRKQP